MKTMRLSATGIAALAAAFLLAACEEKKAEAPAEERPILTAVVQSRPEVPLDFPGTIEPQVSTQKAFRVPGQIVARNVTVGDTVRKGDVLAVLDTAQLKEGVRSAEASVTGAQSQLANAQSVDDRANALAKEGFASPAQIESASQNLAAANANLESAQAQLSKAREQLGYAQLIADYDGIVTASNIEVGETVAASAPVVTIARPDLRDAVIDVPDDVVRRIATGDVFDVTTVLQGDQKIEGKVREIAPSADKLTHTVRVKISLGNAPEVFRIGTTIEASGRNTGGEIVLVPSEAVMSDDGKLTVWKFDRAGSKVVRTQIEAAEGPETSYVVKSGLKGGDLVAVAGIHALKDGQQVKLVEEAAR
ncbi:efflux RND transporter periplasmic adaptor subunit [Rhizobium sp. C4]|uniref:efflux RND transporter periplasmic adaptor subunit n=1 Tax=Rhizobium sp. C4 TaxID=1349800 RepID=UPI001E5753E6|nr:efflux RND transporter periplasmic adaptor subunit [Rhizobium sp. C4]MCD2173427.1 efflux RND transporter periplasmic adaptor subunit [Rhizobium sp. C4]